MVRLLVRAVAIGAVLLALGGAKAWAGMDEGVAAYKRGDFATALREFRLLAAQRIDPNRVSPQFYLGVMYANGRGVPQDYAEAVKWYRKAAEQGDFASQFNLGNLYSNGRGVPQDYVLAHMWFNLAAAQGNKEAVTNRDIIAKLMTPADISKAQRLAREWSEKRRGKKK